MTARTRLIKGSVVTVLVAAAVAGGAMSATAATEFAPPNDAIVIAPGQTGELLTGGIRSVGSGSVIDTVQINFYAPPNATFTSSEVKWVQRIGLTEVATGSLGNNCTLVSSTQIRCDFIFQNVASPATSADTTANQYYKLPVQVSATAPWESRFDGRMVVTRPSDSPVTEQSVTPGESSVGFSTPVDPESPVVDPAVGGAAAAGALGLGAWALVRRRNQATLAASV